MSEHIAAVMKNWYSNLFQFHIQSHRNKTCSYYYCCLLFRWSRCFRASVLNFIWSVSVTTPNRLQTVCKYKRMYIQIYMCIFIYALRVCMCSCILHPFVMLSPADRAVHGGGFPQWNVLSVVMGVLMSHCHLFDAQHHVAFVFLLLWVKVNDG